MRTLALLVAIYLLAACGTKTSLVLPPRHATAGPAAASPAAPPADDSKAGDATAR